MEVLQYNICMQSLIDICQYFNLKSQMMLHTISLQSPMFFELSNERANHKVLKQKKVLILVGIN
jgi:hypothetical protein